MGTYGSEKVNGDVVFDVVKDLNFLIPKRAKIQRRKHTRTLEIGRQSTESFAMGYAGKRIGCLVEGN